MVMIGVQRSCPALRDRDGSDLHRNTANPEQIANAAIQEDVDIVGLSSLSEPTTISFQRLFRFSERKKGRYPRSEEASTRDIPELKKSGSGNLSAGCLHRRYY